MRLVSLLALTALAAFPLVAQAMPPLHAVGVHDASWPNVTGAGTPALDVRVCYPAASAGVDTPLLVRPRGWPTIVFLHGYSLLGRDYGVLADAWAAQGFVVVLLDTARLDYTAQIADGIAVHGALAVANRDKHSVVAGAFDLERIALAGHSMGGGTAGYVLVDNPGYRCALALAPVSPGAGPASQVTVPFGLVVGLGDLVTPWSSFSQPAYQAVAPLTGLKFASLLGPTCDHMNLAGLSGGDDASFVRTVEIAIGFFRTFLDVDHNGIERCIGPSALSAPHLVVLQRQIVEPRVWLASRLAPGRTVRVSVAAEEGLAAVLAGPALVSPVPTLLGALRVDPAHVYTLASGLVGRDRRLDAWLSVPNQPSVVGTRFTLQAIGSTPSAPLRLGTAAEFVVGP